MLLWDKTKKLSKDKFKTVRIQHQLETDGK